MRASYPSDITCANSSLSNCVKVLVDGGYTGETFAQKIKELMVADVKVAKRNELHKFSVLPQCSSKALDC